MEVRNVKYYFDLPFEQYLSLPGVSYSSLSGFSGPATPGMQFGTRVHQYLNEPDQYDWKDAAQVRPIAQAIRNYLGNTYKYFKKEVSFTAEFVHNGMILQYKGRADMIMIGRIIVDIKILSGYLEPSIKRFGYARQQSGYCLATDTPMALILSFNKIHKIVETKIIKPDATFWEYQVVKHGRPI